MIKDKLFNILSKDKRLIDKNGQLLKNKIIELALNLDKDLIDLIISDVDIKKHFFLTLDNTLVFDKIKFQNFILNKEFLPNSFTRFSNYIGLSSNDQFITTNQKVVIDFPYKDCILEGGQTHDDKKNKRNEIFWNKTLAPDDIDRLLEPKSFINWKRYDKKGEHDVKNISTKDNLIIKGNNLIAINSLLKNFRQKIKMIYIDPPYNSGGGEDIFTYNNTFNHATWLTFMKNRLNSAKELLTEDGFICIAIDHHELGYLLVLSDEVFGRENRINVITVAHNPQGRNQEKFFGTSTEFMLVYARNKEIANFNMIALDPKKSKEFNKIDESGRRYKIVSYIRIEDGEAITQKKIERGLHYPIFVSDCMKKVSLDEKDGYTAVYPMKKDQKKVWKKEKKTFLEDFKNGLIVIEKDGSNCLTINEKRFETEVIKTHWVDPKYSARVHGTQRLNKILGSNSVSFPKSIYTVLDTLKLMTRNNDIILDFFAGSGTTGEAVTILNNEDGGSRRFILIEQLDAHLNECIKRNRFAIDKSNSSSSFVYFELAEWNEKAKKQIFDCQNSEQLINKFEELSENYQLRYNLNISQFKNTLKSSNSINFYELSLDEQKKILTNMIDMNQLYINFNDIDDENFNFKDEDINLTKQFYNKLND